MDAVTGKVLYERNADLKRPPASTTKIMTAILLIENTQENDEIVASKKASEADGSSLHLLPGEKVTSRNLLFALMLRSANDGCIAAAEKIAASEEAFAKLMTKKAHDIGALDTIYRNCNGLNDPPNVTTARDLATMTRYAIRYPRFNEAAGSKFFLVDRSIDKEDRHLRNHAKFLWKFPGADGIKTGYTVPAGHCFVGSVTKNGWRLISVVLNSPDWMAETSELMQYGFNRYERHEAASAGKVLARASVTSGVKNQVGAVTSSPVYYVAPRGDHSVATLITVMRNMRAPIRAGDVVGAVEVWQDGERTASYPLVADRAVKPSLMANLNRSGWIRYLLLILFGSVVFIYGRKITKNSRISRRRFAALMREADRAGQGYRQWSEGDRSGDKGEPAER